MAFFSLCLFTFVMFFQPVYVFPELAPIQPYQFSAILALGIFLFLENKKSDAHLFSIPNARFFFLFVLWQTLSSASIWLHGGFSTFKDIWLNLIIIYILILKSCTNEKRIKTIILMITSAIFYLSYKSVSDVLKNYEPGLRPVGFGWYENPNDLVFILACVIPFALCLGELSNSFLKRYFFISIAALFAINILMSASRNGLLGLLVVGSLSLLSMEKVSRFFRYIILGVLMASILTFGLATVFTRSDLQPGQLTGDASSEHRIVQWQACLRMLKHHPILGVGPNQARFLMREYGGVPGLVPHNTLIQAFAETGLPGGFFFFMCTIYPLWEGWKMLKSYKDKMDLPSVIIYKYLLITLSGFWVCAFFSNRVYFKILYVTVALIVAVKYHILESQEGEPPGVNQKGS